jgi:hypothetical protein
MLPKEEMYGTLFTSIQKTLHLFFVHEQLIYIIHVEELHSHLLDSMRFF